MRPTLRSIPWLSPKERDALASLAAYVKPDIDREWALGRGYPEATSNLALLRFLRSVDGNVGKATDNFKQALRMREAMGVHHIRNALVAKSSADYLRFERLPHAKRVLPYWAEHLPTGGRDKMGDVIIWFGKDLCVNFSELRRAVTREEYLEFRIARDVQMQLLLHAMSERAGRLVMQTVVADLRGFTVMELIHMATSSSMRAYRGTYDTKESFCMFPETGGSVTLINTPPLSGPGFAVIRALLPERTMSKFQHHGQHYHKALRKVVADDQLPQQWGGTAMLPVVTAAVVDPV